MLRTNRQDRSRAWCNFRKTWQVGIQSVWVCVHAWVLEHSYGSHFLRSLVRWYKKFASVDTLFHHHGWWLRHEEKEQEKGKNVQLSVSAHGWKSQTPKHSFLDLPGLSWNPKAPCKITSIAYQWCRVLHWLVVDSWLGTSPKNEYRPQHYPHFLSVLYIHA